MVKDRPLPRHALARNLKALLAESGLSAPEVAKRAGVDRKTLNNQLNGRYDPRPEQVDAVAKVFGLSHWQLLATPFNPARAKNAPLQQVIEFFEEADEKGRESILAVAEMAARHKREK